MSRCEISCRAQRQRLVEALASRAGRTGRAGAESAPSTAGDGPSRAAPRSSARRDRGTAAPWAAPHRAPIATLSCAIPCWATRGMDLQLGVRSAIADESIRRCAAGKERVDGPSPHLQRRAVDHQPRGHLQDGLDLAQVVLAQRLARRHQVDDAVGQAGQRRQLDRAVELDDSATIAARLRWRRVRSRELGGVAQVDAAPLSSTRAVLGLGDAPGGSGRCRDRAARRGRDPAPRARRGRRCPGRRRRARRRWARRRRAR